MICNRAVCEIPAVVVLCYWNLVPGHWRKHTSWRKAIGNAHSTPPGRAGHDSVEPSKINCSHQKKTPRSRNKLPSQEVSKLLAEIKIGTAKKTWVYPFALLWFAREVATTVEEIWSFFERGRFSWKRYNKSFVSRALRPIPSYDKASRKRGSCTLQSMINLLFNKKKCKMQDAKYKNE